MKTGQRYYLKMGNLSELKNFGFKKQIGLELTNAWKTYRRNIIKQNTIKYFKQQSNNHYSYKIRKFAINKKLQPWAWSYQYNSLKIPQNLE